MRYLLDTYVVSEPAKLRPEPAVLEWLLSQDESDYFLSALTLGELERGVVQLPPGKRRNSLRHWVDVELSRRFEGRVLPVDASVATRWGQVFAECARQGHPLPIIDSLIAATALVHDLTVVTRNEKDMMVLGLKLLNPWRR